MELNDLVYKKIVKLSEQGDELADNFKYDKAILKYEQALNLLPKPIYNWEAATCLFHSTKQLHLLCEPYLLFQSDTNCHHLQEILFYYS